jgi:hypothetical protein
MAGARQLLRVLAIFSLFRNFFALSFFPVLLFGQELLFWQKVTLLFFSPLSGRCAALRPHRYKVLPHIFLAGTGFFAGFSWSHLLWAESLTFGWRVRAARTTSTQHAAVGKFDGSWHLHLFFFRSVARRLPRFEAVPGIAGRNLPKGGV